MFEMIDKKTLRQQIASCRAEFEKSLKALVEVPSVSVDPAHARDVERCAAVAAGLMKKAGATVKVARTRGFPVVLGAFRAGPRHPTVTIYNHLDVVPAGGADWSRPPFKMAIAGDRFYARGATDDKGPALTALFAARSARELRVPLNIRFLWECEEEIGSPSFEAFLCKTAKSIPTDSVLVSDTIWVARNKPAVSAGLRGLVGVLLALETGEKDCHSGLTGGAARNPLAELAQVVARCVDGRTGRVTIPGFYDGVLPLAREELASFRESGFSLAAFKKAHGLKKLRSGSALSAMKAIWGAPTFEVHGFSGGYQGPGVKTAVPPRGEAKVSMRLVPGQEPRKVLHLLKEHVRRLNPDVRVSGALSLEPFRGVTSGPFAQAAAEAMRFAFGKSPAVVREGGSIGAVVTMEKVLKCPVCLIGLSLPEHGYHGPNEFFDWRQASGGMLAFVKYFEQISRIR